MKSLIAVVVSLILGVSASACRDKSSSLGIDFKIKQKKLSNGLQVVMIEDHTVPVVAYQTWFRVGSVDETFLTNGISHLFEHLMFKGTEKYGPKDFFNQLEAKGAEVNAFTTRDYTVYHETFTPNLLEKVVEMESDRMANLKLDEDVFRNELQVVIEERRMRTDNNPSGRMQEALWEMAYEIHPYRMPVIGYPQTLSLLAVERLKEFYDANYAPSNAVIAVAGDIDPDRTFELVRKAYEGIRDRKQPARKALKEPEQKGERRKTLYDQVAAERFAMAYHVTSAHEEDSYALDVLANILFEGTSSRANQRIVEEKNVAHGIGGSAYTPAYPGLFIITGGMLGKHKTEEAVKLLDEVITDVQSNGVSDEEIQAAVKQLTVELVDSVRTPHGIAQLIGTVMMVFGEPSRYSKDLEKYTKVTREDVKRVANKYLKSSNRSVVKLVPGERPAS